MLTVRYTCVLIFLCCASVTMAQQPAFSVTQQLTFGGSEYESLKCISLTADGGRIATGTTFSSDGNITLNKGVNDVLLMKFNAAGNIEWFKTYGGSSDDGGYAVEQTTDGGYIIAGYTRSNDGDVSGFHSTIDCWIIKTNSMGVIQWQKAIGGAGSEVASAIKQVNGGFIFCGYTLSKDGDITQHRDAGDNQDFWLVKLDNNGNKLWDKCFGGSDHDFPHDMILTSDNGVVIAGYSQSANMDISSARGKRDVWVVKTDMQGNLLWQKSIGGSEHDLAERITETPDGHLILCGQTNSSDKDVSGFKGLTDALVIKLSANGQLIWAKCFGGTDLDAFRDVRVTADGKYLFTGSSESHNGDAAANKGWSDFWLVQTDANGNLIWQKNFGGSNIDDAFALSIKSNGNILLTGSVFSGDGDVQQTLGGGDIWLAEIQIVNPLPVITQQPTDTTLCKGSPVQFQISANNVQSYQWQIWMNNSWQHLTNDNIFSGVSGTTLTVNTALLNSNIKLACTVKNQHGTVQSLAFTLSISDKPSITAISNNAISCIHTQHSLSVTAAADYAPFNYTWQSAANPAANWNSIGQQQSITVSSNQPAVQYYRALVSNSCGTDTSHPVQVQFTSCTIPNAFSPNGDGMNDTWNISLPQPFRLQIVNRYGSILHNGTHTAAFGWNGRHNNQPLPPGVYYYLIETQNKTTITGSLTILY